MIDIIIPFHNANLTLKRALESLIKQTYRDFSIILIDDAGEENPSEIISSYQDKLPIRYYRLAGNVGVAAARQCGINLSRAEYLCFLDADDTLLPEALEALMQGIGTHGWVSSHVQALDERGQFIGLSNNQALVLGKLFRRQFLLKHHIHFYTELRFGEDVTFCWLADFYEDIQDIHFPTYQHWENAQSLTHSIPFKKYNYYYLGKGFLKLLERGLAISDANGDNVIRKKLIIIIINEFVFYLRLIVLHQNTLALSAPFEQFVRLLRIRGLDGWAIQSIKAFISEYPVDISEQLLKDGLEFFWHLPEVFNQEIYAKSVENTPD